MQLKKLLFLTTFFCCFFTITAQKITQAKQDSLMIIWNDVNQHDTIRLNAIHRVAWEGFRLKNPDSAYYYAQLQYNLANATNNKESMIRALNVQGDSRLIKGMPDEAYEILTQASQLAEEIGDKKLLLKSLGNTSQVFKLKGEFEKALEYNLRTLKISEEIQDQSGIAMSLTNIGDNYIKKGDLVQGLEHLNRAKKIFEALEQKYMAVIIQSKLANIYLQQGNSEEALKLLRLNVAYFEETGNEKLRAGELSNMGGIYSSQGNNKKAIETLEQALAYFNSINSMQYIAAISQNLAPIYVEEGDLELALKYATKSLNLYQKIKNANGIAIANNSIAIILSNQGEHPQAISYGNEALTFFQAVKDMRGISQTSENLINSYKATGNYKKAFEMNKLYYQMRDSLASKENQKAIIQMQVQADYDKQKAIDDIENEKEVAIEIQKTDTLQKISIAIGSGLLLISFLSLIIFNRLKETRQQKAVIEEQKKKVEQSEKYKEQFLANMSHEIRTPMHAISGMTKILKRNDHPPTQDVYLNAMQTSTENLVVILNDVLDLSKIEAGKLEVEQIPMNPESVIVNVVQLLKFKAEEKGLVLSYDIADNVPDFVMGDSTRLNQILLNLAGNAIKFTEKGKVDISLTTESEELRFSVKDTGIGVAQEKLEHIFEAFEQAKGSTSRFYGGTGLGLSISKQLVELQQGKIWAESTQGQGSTFYVTLPLTLAAENAVGQAIISAENLKMMMTSLQGIRILIAEDNPFNQMIAQDDLSYYLNDVTIETVENGVLAVEKFKSNSYDLILMDVQMPEMNGFEATKKIRELERAQEREKAIPIIAMTASLLKTEIDSCYAAGMNNYIPKPYKLEELIGPIFKELRS
jgi:signal transduction histidine kinase/CheY-like chemotaxis protein